MNNFNICVLGYNSNYKKFLSHIKDKKTKYQLKLIDKTKNINNFDYSFLKNKLIKDRVKILALCDKNFISLISNDIDFFIKKRIKIVQASNNYEVDNYGFIIEKPFKDYSFEELFLRKTLNLDLIKNSSLFKNKKIAITGGAGSIGSGLVKKLINFDVKKIYVIDNNEYNIFKLRNSINKVEHSNKIEYYLTNIDNANLLNLNFKKIKPNIVFHAAALKHVLFLEKNISQGIITNVLGTKNTILAAAKNNTQYFIHISTDKAADPKNVLGYTKLLSEYVCHNFKKSNMKIGIVRFGNIFNSFGSVAETIRNQIFQVKKIKLSHPSVERYFMSITEATNLIISTLQIISKNQNKKKCRTFICDMGTPIKIKDLAIKILYLSGRIPEKYISKSYYGLKNMEKLTENLISKKEKIIKIINNRIFEISCVFKKIDEKKILKITAQNFNNIKLKRNLIKLI
jgi:FlaA1/EpsC-like NDP-sugar epimerase